MEHGDDRSTRKRERLKALLKIGGTMENQGASLHLGDLRMDVSSIADMSDEAWSAIWDSLKTPSGIPNR